MQLPSQFVLPMMRQVSLPVLRKMETIVYSRQVNLRSHKASEQEIQAYIKAYIKSILKQCP